MLARIKPYIAPVLVGLALLLIGVVGHRHWWHADHMHSPPVIEEIDDGEDLPVITKPVKEPAPVVKPMKKTKPKPNPGVKKTKPAPKRVVPTPVEPPQTPWWRRECDETGWCWTYFPWD